MVGIIRTFLKIIRRVRLAWYEIVILGLVAMGVIAMMFLRTSKQSTEISVKLIVTNSEMYLNNTKVQYWFGDALKPGMQAKNSVGEKIAEITDVNIYDAGTYGRHVSLTVKLKVIPNKDDTGYSFNYIPMTLGRQINIPFANMYVRGTVIQIGEIEEYKTKIVEVEIPSVQKYIADRYVKGLTAYDSLSRKVATIEEVISNSTATVNVFSDIRGKVMVVEDPGLNKVRLKLKVLTFSSGGYYYYLDRGVIKIGEKITIQFPQDIIREAEILAIESE